MTGSNPASPPDVLADAAALVRDVGLSAERARRYRALAASLAEPTFDEALALGSTIRRAGRDPARGGQAIAAAVDELRQLLARSEAAIAGVRASAQYRDAVRRFAEGAVERVVPLAIDLFTDVVAGAASGVLTWDVPVTGGADGEHFAAPEECVARIIAAADEGISAALPPPSLGGDEAIRPVTLSSDLGGAETPISLAFEIRELPAPVARLEHGATALYYAERLRAPFTVQCAGSVTDEWWTVRPDAYAKFVAALGPLLRTRGLTLTVTP